MSEKLTAKGHAYAVRHEHESIVARVALHGSENWPPAHVEAAIEAVNEQAERESPTHRLTLTTELEAL